MQRLEYVNWDDLRFILAVARAGSLSGAARQLGVNQTTVGRRLSALERRLGAPLFLRNRSGFRLTDAGEVALAQIEVMESAALEFGEKVGLELQRPAGLVRIASMHWIFNDLLLPALPRLTSLHPNIEIHAIADVRERSLSDREAELALRFEMGPRGKERAYKIAAVPYSIYAPCGVDVETLPWIASAVDSGDYAPERWFNSASGGGAEGAGFRANDAGILYRAVRAGLGKGLLPDHLARSDTALTCLSASGPELVRELRVLVHPDVERFARVQAVLEWLRQVFGPQA